MIRVWGSGLAGLAVAALLSRKQFDYEVVAIGPNCSDQPLLLGSDTVDLIETLFAAPGELWRMGHCIDRRDVFDLCGRQQTVPERSLAIRMNALVQLLPSQELVSEPTREHGIFDVDATGRRAAIAQSWPEQVLSRFGQRKMLVADVEGTLNNAIMQMTTDGWLFAFPINCDRVIIQAMVCSETDQPNQLLRNLARKHLIPYLTMHSEGYVQVIDAAPQRISCMATPTGLAVGASAFAMDPICGDGTGATLRSAILAAAAIEESGTDKPAALAHYQARLNQSFEAHLTQVAKYYSPLTQCLPWIGELQSTYSHVQYMKLHNSKHRQEFQYDLKDGRLVSRLATQVSEQREGQHV